MGTLYPGGGYPGQYLQGVGAIPVEHVQPAMLDDFMVIPPQERALKIGLQERTLVVPAEGRAFLVL